MAAVQSIEIAGKAKKLALLIKTAPMVRDQRSYTYWREISERYIFPRGFLPDEFDPEFMFAVADNAKGLLEELTFDSPPPSDAIN